MPSDSTDFNSKEYKLTNGEVKLALAGYDSTRQEIRDHLLAENVLIGTTGPFGFDLSRIAAIRDAIKNVVENRPSRNDRPNSKLGRFQRELILATADATRRDREQLVLHLYTALMERHAELVARNSPNIEDDKKSEAGEYLLRCMVVQAAYDNLATYRFIVEQFARVIEAIHVPDEHAHLLQRLLYGAGEPPGQVQPATVDGTATRGIDGTSPQGGDAPEDKDPTQKKPTQAPTQRRRLILVKTPKTEQGGYGGNEDRRTAFALGEQLAKNSHVALLEGASEEDSLSGRVRAGALAARGRVLCVMPPNETAKQDEWAPLGPVLILRTSPATHAKSPGPDPLFELKTLAEGTIEDCTKEVDVNKVDLTKKEVLDELLYPPNGHLPEFALALALRRFLAVPNGKSGT